MYQHVTLKHKDVRPKTNPYIDKKCKCGHINQIPTDHSNKSPTDGNFFNIQCDKCDHVFFKCGLCCIIRGDRKNILKHINKEHAKKPLVNTSDLEQDGTSYLDQNEMDMGVDFGLPSCEDYECYQESNHLNQPVYPATLDPTTTPIITLEDFKEMFSNPTSALFFWQQYFHNSGDGGRMGGVGRTFLCNSKTNSKEGRYTETDMSKYANKNETEYMFHLTGLLHRLTDTERDELCVSNRYMLLGMREHSANNETPSMDTVQVPTSLQDIHMYFLDNRNSMLRSLPMSKVCIFFKHSYISFDELIDHIMAHGVDLDFFDPDNPNQKGLNGTTAMREMYERLKNDQSYTIHTKIGYLLLWSDAFKVSYVRSKDNSIWIATVTLCPPQTSAKISKFHTYIVAMGLKKWSVSRRKIMNMLMQLAKRVEKGKWRWDGKANKKVHTMFGVLAWNGDRPERMEICGLRDGKEGNCFGHSMVINRNKFPSCKACKKKRKIWIHNWSQNPNTIPSSYIHSCRECQDFRLQGTTQVFQSPLPAGYPTGVHENSPKLPELRDQNAKYLFPFKQEFHLLKAAVMATYFNVITAYWKITYHRDTKQPQCKSAEIYLAKIGLNQQVIDDLMEEIFRKGRVNNHGVTRRELHNIESIPEVWSSSLSLSGFMISPMHLIFLGVVKSIVGVFRSCCLHFKKSKAFLRKVEPLMLNISDYKLKSWRLEIFNYGSSTAYTTGWLCDNCVAFSRIMPVTFTVLFNGIVEKSNEKYSQSLVEALSATIISLFVLIYQVMSPDDISPAVIHQHVKVFLSCCHQLELSREDWVKEKEHFWVKKPNFVTLLRLADQIQHYGPVRFANELNTEREIQFIKPIMTNLRQTQSYVKLKLEKMQQTEVLDILCAKTKENPENKEDWFMLESRVRGNGFIIYRDYKTITDKMKSKESIVACRRKNSDQMYVAYGTRKQIHLVALDVNRNHAGEHHLALYYSRIELRQVTIQNIPSFDTFITAFPNTCLVIPLLDGKRNKNNVWTVICSSWKIKKRSGEFKLPTLPNFAL